MKIIVRVLALLSVCLFCTVANADNWDSYMKFLDGNPEVTGATYDGFENGSAKINVTIPSRTVECRGRNHFWGGERITNLTYNIRWQYRIENGSWSDYTKYEGNWKAGSDYAPTGWQGHLANTYNKTQVTLAENSYPFNVHIPELYSDKATISMDFRIVWSLRVDLEGSAYHTLDGESASVSCTIYQCKGGSVKVNTNIPDKGTYYAIYDEEAYKKAHNVQFTTSDFLGDVKDAKFVDDDKFVWKNINPQTGSPYVSERISVYYFENGCEGSNTVGTNAWEIKAYYTVPGYSCYSSSVSFYHFDKVVLAGKPAHFEEERQQHICMDSEKSKVTFQGINATMTEYFTEKDYGLQYKWEYSLDGSNWNTVQTGMNATVTGTDLTVSGRYISTLNATDIVYFRPKAYLELFDWDVLPEQNVVYEVHPYTIPTTSNMKLELSDKSVCSGVEFGDGKGIITLKKKYASDVFNPNLQFSIDPTAERYESVDEKNNELAKWKISAPLTQTTTYTVYVEDQECGSNGISFPAQVKVESVESDPEEEITIAGCSYRYENGKIYIQVKEGNTIKFGKNSTNYKYVLNEGETARQLPASLPMNETNIEKLKTTSYSLQKINGGVNSLGCEGEAIPVIIEVVEDIKNNEIRFENLTSVKGNTYYLCKGEKNPKIIGSENIAGGYGDQTIIWKFKDTGKQIPGTENETFSLSAGMFEVVEDCEIVRVVRMGDGVFESVSDPLRIKVYTAPSFSITEYDAVVSKADVCYEEKPIFNISYESDEPKIASHIGKTSYRIQTYKDVDGQKAKVDTLITGASKYNSWQFVYDAKITATQEFCSTQVEASNAIDVTVKGNLAFSDNDFAYDCPVLGKDLDITPKTDDGSVYSYKVGGKTVTSESEGTSTIKMPSVVDDITKNTVNVDVTRTFDGCSRSQTIKIKNVLTPLEDRSLFLVGSLDANSNLVCLSKDYKIEDNGTNEANVKYTWTSKTTGASIVGGTSKDVNVSLSNGNEFIRTRVLGNNCEVKRDTIAIDVLAKTTAVPSFTASSAELCHGDEVVITADKIPGYKVTGWVKTAGAATTDMGSDNTIKEFVEDAGTVTYTVTMASELCDNYTLQGKETIKVAPDLKIKSADITVSPSDISKSLFDDKTKAITVKLTDKNDLGQSNVAFSFNGSDFKQTVISDGEFSANYTLEESDLDDRDMVEGMVFRTYKLSSTKSCVSDTFHINKPVNNGFESIVINPSSENINAGDIFYFCGKGTLQLVNDEIIFNNDVLEKGYKLQWYKKTNGVWTSIKDATKAEVEISTAGLENRSEFYKLEVSLTSDGKLYKQASNAIEVRNVATPNLNIRLSDGDIYFCHAGKSEFQLQTNTWSSPDGAVDAKNTYTWQRSYDGSTWQDVVATSTDNLNIEIATKEDVSTLSYTEESMTKPTYFRAVLTDLCGAKATSNTILTKTYRGMDLTSKDVNVMSNKLVQNKDSFEVKFFVNYSDDKVYSYTYYNEDNQVVESKGTASQSFVHDTENGDSHADFDYSFGKHKVYVEKVMIENGCKSDKVEVEYELIAPLKIEIQNGITNQCPDNDKQNGYINIVYMDGGLPENGLTATWYYRYDNEEYFKKIDNSVDFRYIEKENDKEDITAGKIFDIHHLDRTCHFYAEIANEGYPIKAVKTSVVTMEINPKFKIERATCDKSQYCYGEDVRLTSGSVESSFGDVTYRWIDLNDKTAIYPSTEILDLESIKGQTTFRRIATDGCGIKDTFDVDLAVREKLEMSADEYEHANYAEMGKIPYIAVKDLLHVESYVVSHINQDGVKDVKEEKTFGVTDLSFGTMPAVGYEIERFEIYKVDRAGCMSVPDTFTVKGIEKITAGTIAFERYGDTKSINICHGEKIGRIIDDEIASGGTDITYKWIYAEVGKDENYVRDSAGLPLTTSVFDADTTNFGTVVAKNVAVGNKVKTSYVFRQASINVMQPDGTYTPYIKNSDTLYINVAPQLSNCNIENLAGSIQTQSNAYCGGAEVSGAITLTTDEEVIERYEAKDFGALLFGEGYELYGYWETSKGGQKNFAQASSAVTYEDGFESKFYVEDFDSTTYVRFAINDGCSVLGTDYKALTVISFDKDSTDNYTIDRQAVEERYIEIGDNIKVTNRESTMSGEWYSNKNEKSLISEEKTVTLDSVTFMTRLYHKRIKTTKGTTCIEPEYYEIPLNVHPVSKGGRIRNNQQVCPGVEFEDIKSYENAFGGTGKFRYRWEITTDSSDAYSWRQIDNAFDDSLNYATYRRRLDTKKTNFIRRTATPIYNDKEVGEAYTRYSNVISLETYKTLKASSLAWKGEGKNSYCSEERVPSIIADAPTGGSAEYKETKYGLDWMYSVDGTNWIMYTSTYVDFGGTSEISGNGIVYTYFEEKKRDKDVIFYVKAVFKDDECGEVETEPFSFKVWAETEDPALYIGADSCNSKYISFVVENDKDYYYNWTIGTDSVNPVKTDFKEQYTMSFERHPAYIVEEGYTVQGMHKTSGCKTGIVYFNVDSLPELKQDGVAEQDGVLCYGSDLKISHTTATGGTGTKSYLWQYSYDNEKWNDANAGQDFTYEDVRSDMYIRRLAFTDVCPDTIATDAVLYKVADKIEPLKVSIEENMCKNQDMVVTLADSMVGNFNVAVYRLQTDTVMETELTPEKLTGKIKGNDLAENIFGIVTWDSSYSCKSEMIKTTVVPRPDFTGYESSISGDAETVCEGSSITITSATDYSLPQYLKQRFETSADGIAWSAVKENSEFKDADKVVANDTAYYRTILFNGCKDSIVSNIIKVDVKETIDNPMTFEVETKSDGEIEIAGYEDNEMVALSLLLNDSVEYNDGFVEKVTLAKETEKIVVRTKYGIHGNRVCYSPVTIKPLKGGNIFTECKSTGKQIVGEDVANAGSDVTYKWFKFGNDNTMMYFTDVTDKNYTITVDEEKSLMLRVSYYDTDNIKYVLKSNILTVNANGPALSKIVPLEKNSMLSAGLKVNDHFMELNIGMNATLSCFIDDASKGEWQQSEDGLTWVTADKFDSTRLASQNLAIEPSDAVYYRIVATNSCGTTTSDSLLVAVEAIPGITEGCLELTLDDCEKTATVICYDDEQKNYRPNHYEYYFEVNGEAKKELVGEHGISLSGITGEIEVVITRSYKGITTKYMKRIDMSKSVGAGFSIIAEGVEYGSSDMTGEWIGDVLVTDKASVPSGTKIMLNNRSENGTSYKWEVYYEGIKMATSLVENPQIYVYNEGSYSFFLTAYSGKCESSVNWESGVEVQSGTLRYADVDMKDDFVLEDDFILEKNGKHKNLIHFICVSPTLVTNQVSVRSSDVLPHDAMLVDEFGRILHTVSFSGSVQISMNDYISGSYFIVVDNQERIKIIKK